GADARRGDGGRHGRVRDAVRRAVGGDASVPERGPAAAYRVGQRLLARDVEDRVLLTGKGRSGQILRGGGRPHCDGTATQSRVGIARRGRDRAWYWRGAQALGRTAGIARIDAGGSRRNGVGRGRQHEAVGYGEARPLELAQVRALASGDVDVRGAEVEDPPDQPVAPREFHVCRHLTAHDTPAYPPRPSTRSVPSAGRRARRRAV